MQNSDKKENGNIFLMQITPHNMQITPDNMQIMTKW
jgi:hypothetical protein